MIDQIIVITLIKRHYIKFSKLFNLLLFPIVKFSLDLEELAPNFIVLKDMIKLYMC